VHRRFRTRRLVAVAALSGEVDEGVGSSAGLRRHPGGGRTEAGRLPALASDVVGGDQLDDCAESLHLDAEVDQLGGFVAAHWLDAELRHQRAKQLQRVHDPSQKHRLSIPTG
jgi:hypothetical protein